MYGARPIRRWVQKNVITKLSELLIGGEIGEGSTIHIDAKDDKLLKYEVVKEVGAESRRKRRRRRHDHGQTGKTKKAKGLSS
jgi:ATP-dependent Clp protease ATP-binding subunit ClpA